jgi:hypothetical protein
MIVSMRLDGVRFGNWYKRMRVLSYFWVFLSLISNINQDNDTRITSQKPLFTTPCHCHPNLPLLQSQLTQHTTINQL